MEDVIKGSGTTDGSGCLLLPRGGSDRGALTGTPITAAPDGRQRGQRETRVGGEMIGERIEGNSELTNRAYRTSIRRASEKEPSQARAVYRREGQSCVN